MGPEWTPTKRVTILCCSTPHACLTSVPLTLLLPPSPPLLPEACLLEAQTGQSITCSPSHSSQCSEVIWQPQPTHLLSAPAL